MKEFGNDVWRELKVAQGSTDFALEFILGLRCGLGDTRFDVCPGQFIGIELGRVRWQEEQFDLVAMGRNEIAHEFGLVCWMAINNQKDFAVDTRNKPLQKSRNTAPVTLPSTVMNRKWPSALTAESILSE